MSEPVFFEWIEIEGFRGFAKRQRLDLDTSVVILAGPNGTGKTSFFDAMQWLLIGTLERLEPWRVRRNAEHVVNQYQAAAGEPATVSASLRIDGRSVELRRTGRYDRSQLEWRDESVVLYESDAEHALAEALTPVGRMSLQRALLSSGLLQQDVIRDVLEDKPAERYDQLAAILGLNAIVGFPAAAKKRADRLAADGERARKAVADLEAAARGARERITSLRARAVQAPDAAALRAQLAERIGAHTHIVRLRGELPLSSGDAQELRMAAGLAADTLGGLLTGADPALEALAAETAASPETLDALQVAAEAAALGTAKARQTLAEAERRYEEERQVSSRLGRLATEAMPLLEADCPVCGQAIDAEHVRAHLEQVIAEGSVRLPEFQRARDEAATELAKRHAEEEQAAKALAEMAARAERIAQARAEQKAWRARVAEAVREHAERFEFREEAALTEGESGALRATRDALAEISRAASELVSAFDWVGETAAVSTAQTQLSEIEAQIVEARERGAKASATEDEARTLQRAAVRAAASVTEERFAILRPIIQDVYTRLDPHPTFTGLHFAVDVYRERGIASPQVLDPEHDLTADPLLVFSSSQANVVALSAFLALGWAAGEDAMPFLLLDDPLQSLDDVNTLGFADLCRHMRTRRQLIVSTHDLRLANLLERKLAPRREDERTRSLRFVAWSRSGPLIDGSEIEPQVEQGTRRALIPTGRKASKDRTGGIAVTDLEVTDLEVTDLEIGDEDVSPPDEHRRPNEGEQEGKAGSDPA
jgi:DNA repair exonuclease SbcCD ATPase subunit